MNDSNLRMKQRAARATVGSLLAFILFVMGIAAGSGLQQSASNPDLDVRAIVTELTQDRVDGRRAAAFDRIPWVERGIQAAAIIEDGRTIAYTFPERKMWEGHRITLFHLTLGLTGPGSPPMGPFGAPMGPGGPPPMPGPMTGAPPTSPDAHAPYVPPGGYGPPGHGHPMGHPAAPMASGGGPWAAVGPPGMGMPYPVAPATEPRELDPRQMEEAILRLLGRREETMWGPQPRSASLRERNGQDWGRLYYIARPNWQRYGLGHSLVFLSGAGAALSALFYWLLLPWWVYLDARGRTTRAVPLALFVGLTNFLGWLTYLVIRPDGEQCCPVCALPMLSEYRLCPRCGYTESTRCPQCRRPARPDWRFCPYCETPRADGQLGA